ncbi:MAG TPA: hypothetical protein VKB79_08310, partial [Bryobacteraceae bacterium]|nr:hypothetical protein [Bryobacteraceae bacterium]
MNLIGKNISTPSLALLPLLLGVADHASIAMAQSFGTFTATGSMTVPRAFHTATLLPDGKVLIAGGGSATLELYDPVAGTFTATATTASAIIGAATLLPNGTVLLIEATETQTLPPSFLYTRNAELYDPATGTVTPTASTIDGQTGYSATLLTNGKVLMTGGNYADSDDSKAANPELYDPSS